VAAKKSVPTVKVTKLARAPTAPVLSRAHEAVDEFRPYYADDSLGAGMALIEPPYNPAILQCVVSENNTLEARIDAMITNIDLTGDTIECEYANESSTGYWQHRTATYLVGATAINPGGSRG
jgi:hypothetical protein